MDSDNTVKSVDRALQILKLVARKKEGSGVTELSNGVDINKSSVYRILSTLVKHRLVEQDPSTEKYKLGYGLLELSTRLLESIDLRTEAYPFLRELEKETNEVIHLVVYDQGKVVYIEKLEGTETLRMHSQMGRRAPVHCTAVGKAILAYLPTEQVYDILNHHGMSRHTPKTITELDPLMEQLQEVRERGFALDNEENEMGIICVAAPIFDHRAKAFAAISVSGPIMRMSDERQGQLIDLVKETSVKISQRMGYKGPNQA
jgi:IclR family KDG regulon transcriptional repressor